MKKTILLLKVLCLLLLSWNAYSQTNCAPGGPIEGCTPTIQYDVDESGNLLVATVDVDTNTGYLIGTKIFLRTEGSQLTIVKELDPLSSVRQLKLIEDKVIYKVIKYRTTPGQLAEVSVAIKIIQKDPMGNYVESNLFPELVQDYVNFYTYGYDNLTFLDGYAYVKRIKQTNHLCDAVYGMCGGGIATEITYLKANLATGAVEVVGSIPESPPIEGNRYFIYPMGNDIYRVDTLNNYETTLWIQGYNEDGVENTFTFSMPVGDLVYYAYKSLDGSTSLAVVNVTDEVPKPIKILVANLAGWIFWIEEPQEKKQSALVFRETDDSFLDTFTGQGDIPGWDHVGLWIAAGDKMYESMPTEAGLYYDPIEKKVLTTNGIAIDEVQQFHTLGSFTNIKHGLSEDLAKIAPSKAVKSHVIEINENLAKDMEAHIKTKLGLPYLHVPEGEKVMVGPSYMPLLQKGGQTGNGAYTCIGLIEAAAEAVGHNLGLGFIPNQVETIDVGIKFSLLIPDWLAYWAKKDQASEGLVNYMIGALDPVDFLITDPLGRRLGHIDGQTYNEIPEAYYNGNGNAEIFLIPKLEDGVYQFKFKGLGEETVSGIKSIYNGVTNEILINKHLNLDEVTLKTIDVSQPQIFSPHEIIERLDESIVNGNYKAKILAFTAIAKNIEEQVEKNHMPTAKVLGKVLASEFKLFLKDSPPERGLNEEQALQHLNNYLNNLN